MKLSRTKSAAFTVVEMLVVLAILAVLVWMAIPVFSRQGSSDVSALSNARQLHMVTQQMSLDNFNAGKELQWTTKDVGGKSMPVSLAEYFAALTNSNAYLTDRDLRKLLTVGGKGPGPWAAPNEENIAFRIFAISEESPSEQPFVVTANWKNGALTDDKPYGRKGFVLFTKGGGGGIHKATNISIFPTGPKYRYDTLE